MTKKNCWQVKNCGRQPGGENIEELGICPVTITNPYDETNNGIHGGRFCWRIAGSFCGGKPQGTAAQKLMNCLDCEFFKQVVEEEGSKFKLSQADFPQEEADK